MQTKLDKLRELVDRYKNRNKVTYPMLAAEYLAEYVAENIEDIVYDLQTKGEK